MSIAEIVSQLEELPEEKKQVASDFIAFLLSKSKDEKAGGLSNTSNENAEIPTTGFGCMKGMFKMAPDFDEPLEDFKEYM